MDQLVMAGLSLLSLPNLLQVSIISVCGMTVKSGRTKVCELGPFCEQMAPITKVELFCQTVVQMEVNSSTLAHHLLERECFTKLGLSYDVDKLGNQASLWHTRSALSW